VAGTRGGDGGVELSRRSCVGPPLVTRALRGPTEASEWGSASSGGHIADETLMASKFRKAVQYASHSANEGHRHQFQPQQYSFGYQQLQGLDAGEKRGKTPGARMRHPLGGSSFKIALKVHEKLLCRGASVLPARRRRTPVPRSANVQLGASTRDHN
jgi:hypothetical protein